MEQTFRAQAGGVGAILPDSGFPVALPGEEESRAAVG